MTKIYAIGPMFLRVRTDHMAAAGSSMLYSLFLFVATLSLQEMFRAKLASSELFTILGGFTSSIVFLTLLTVRECDVLKTLYCMIMEMVIKHNLCELCLGFAKYILNISFTHLC